MAELFPKNLENSPTSHTNPYPIDSSAEARAQDDITEFFSGGPIVPTPDDVVRKKNFLYRSPIKRNNNKVDSWCNTILSLPPVLPPNLQQMLEPYFTVINTDYII